jgi:hypothetical protein
VSAAIHPDLLDAFGAVGIAEWARMIRGVILR